MAQYMLQTLDGDPQIPSNFSFLSPPVYVQPLPDPPPASSPKQNPPPISSPHQDPLSISSIHQDPLPISLPAIVLHNDSSSNDDFAIHSPIYQQSTDDNLDMIITEDPSVPDHTDSSTHDHINLPVYNHSDYSGSDISAHLPPSSNLQTEVNSAVTSDSDLPPPPVKQSNLLNFFSVVPTDEAYTTWAKRKRDNQERDEEKRAEVMHQQEEWREKKCQKLRDRNRVSQQKHRKKIKNQGQEASIQGEGQKQLSVSKIFISKTTN